MKTLKMTMLSSVCAFAVTAAFPVLAQESAADGSGEAVEVIITANKKRESLQMVPSSVDAITAQTIDKLNIQNFQDIEKVSPGLQLNAADGRGQNISLRGVSFDPDTGAGPTVQVYWNETPISTSTAFRGLFDVGQIEVLKGPQGTLRGQTSPAGAITIATRKPDLNFTEGNISQTVGSHRKFNTQIGLNVPLIEGKLALRVAGLYDYGRDGVRNVVNGRENSDMTHGARASLLFKPVDSLEIMLVHQEINNRLVNYHMVVGAPLTAQGQAAGQALTYEDRAAVAEGDADFYNRSKLTSLNVNWDLAGHRLSYIGGYQKTLDIAHRDQDFTAVVAGYTYQQDMEISSSQFTHEIRFESVDNSFWNYMVGAYYSRSTNDLYLTQPQSVFDLGPYQEPIHVPMEGYSRPGGYAKGKALFTNHRFAITENDQIEIGLRYQENESDFQQYINIMGMEIPSVPEDMTYRKTDAVTGSASYRHVFSRDLMTYISYGRGLRPGGITSFVTTQGIDPAFLVYEDETTDALEIGVKSKWLNRRLTFNASLFKQEIKNYIGRANNLYVRVEAQPGEPDGPGPNGGYLFTGNANLNTNGDVESTGLEALVGWSFSANWNAQLSLSYVDAHYVNAVLPCNDSDNDGIADEVHGPYVQPGRQISLCANNDTLPNTDNILPGKFNASLQSEYSRAVGDLELFARGLVRYVPEGYNRVVGQKVPSYTPVDFYLGVRSPNQSWELSFWAQNLFDKTVNRGERYNYVGSVAGGYRSVITPEERRLGVTLRYNFGQ